MKQHATSIKYGIITGIFLIGYFALLGALGYIKSPVYSIFNALICALGIFMAISEKSTTSEHFTYKMGFQTGIVTGIIATIIFTVFFGIFAARQEGLITSLTEQLSFIKMNFFLLIFTVAGLGLISVYVVTFILMRYFRKSWKLS